MTSTFPQDAEIAELEQAIQALTEQKRELMEVEQKELESGRQDCFRKYNQIDKEVELVSAKVIKFKVRTNLSFDHFIAID